MSKYFVAFVCFTLAFGSVLLNSQSPQKVMFSVERPYVAFSAVYYKIRLFFLAINRLLTFFNTGEYQYATNRQSLLCQDKEFVTTKVKTIYYIRHGQSTWNASFTEIRNIFKLVFNTARIIIIELMFLFTNESFVYDAPLTCHGIAQSLDVAQFLSEPHANPELEADIMTINGENRPSVLFASYLRRAQSTLMLALQSRLRKGDEKIYITHELEELALNPDCVSLYSSFGCITFPVLETIFSPESFYKYQRLKRVEGTNTSRHLGYTKMLSFLNRIFNEFDEDTFIVCGHSRWLRHAINIFFPPNSIDTEYTKRKLSNAGVIRFDVHLKRKPNGEKMFLFDPNSFKVIHGTFVLR